MERGRDGRGGNAKMRYDCGEDGGEGESERSERVKGALGFRPRLQAPLGCRGWG